MTRRSIAGFLAAALALPAIAVAQTGTATSSPATSRIQTTTLKLDDALKTALTAPADDLPVLGEDQVEIDPRAIAEFGKAQAKHLADMQGRTTARSDACGRPDVVANSFRRAAVALSLADSEMRWRNAIVRVQSAVADLKEAAAKGRQGAAECGLDAAENAEAVTIAANMTRREAVLKEVLQKGFKRVFAQSDDAVSLLSALAVSQTEGTKQLAVSPFDYFFSNRWRLYVRSTLVIDEEEKEDADSSTAGNAASDEPTPEDLADSVKLALLDPFGGPLNVSGGYFAKIPTAFLKGDGNDLHHGLFADLRAGLKFVDLPEQKLTIVDGKTRNTPFYQAAAAIRLLLPVFKGAPGNDNPGGVEVALTGSWNRVADIGASELFASKDGSPALLDRDTRNLHLATKMDLPDAASLQISGTLWSSSKFDRRFLIGFGLNRKPAAPKAASAAAADK